MRRSLFSLIAVSAIVVMVGCTSQSGDAQTATPPAGSANTPRVNDFQAKLDEAVSAKAAADEEAARRAAEAEKARQAAAAALAEQEAYENSGPIPNGASFWTVNIDDRFHAMYVRSGSSVCKQTDDSNGIPTFGTIRTTQWGVQEMTFQAPGGVWTETVWNEVSGGMVWKTSDVVWAYFPGYNGEMGEAGVMYPLTRAQVQATANPSFVPFIEGQCGL